MWTRVRSRLAERGDADGHCGATMTTSPGRTTRAVRLVTAAVGLVTLSACNFGMNPGATQQGRDINGLYRLLFWFAIPIGVIVYGLILWSVIRYRKRGNDDGAAEADPLRHPARGDVHGHPGR